MNSLLTWISVHSVLNTTPNVIYPNFEVKGSTPPWQHELLAEFYNEGGENPGHDAVNFYLTFRNYLTATPGWVDIFRWIGALLGVILWYVAESLQFMYVKLFGLMRISTISDYASKAQYLGGHFGIHDLFVDANDFGLIVFSIVLLIYVIGTIINNPTYERYKNILRNTCLILFFLFCLPFMTSEFGQGVNDFAQGMFGNQVASTSTTSSDAQSTAHESSLANLAFYNNTVSIPTRIESTVPGQSILDGTDSSGHEIYQLGGSSQSASPIQGLDSNADPIMIDLTEMSFTQKDRWNGLGSESIPEFLLDYASPSESMDTNALSKYANTASMIMSKKSEPGANSGWEQELHERYLKNSESPLTRGSGTNTDIAGHPIVSKGLNWFNEVNPVDIGWRIGNSIGADMTQDKYESNYKTLFEYHVADAGPGVGETAAAKGLSSHDVDNFDSSVSKIFARSYNFYHVSWMAVYAQLIMIILILGEYTIKIFQMMFKLIVMYISSGLILLRNADNYQRIKNWMRDLFSIYEMAIMDIIMVYVSLYIIYPAYHEFDDHILVTTNNAYLANPYSITLLNLIGDLALFGCAAKGLNSVDRAVGSSGGGANSGTSGVFKSAIALTAAHGAMNAGTRVAGDALGLGANGVKGLYKKGKAGLVGRLSGRRSGKKDMFKDAKKNGLKNKSNAALSQRPHDRKGLSKAEQNANKKHGQQQMANAAAKKQTKHGLNHKPNKAKGTKNTPNGKGGPNEGNATKDQLGKSGFGKDGNGSSDDSQPSGTSDTGSSDDDSSNDNPSDQDLDSDGNIIDNDDDDNQGQDDGQSSPDDTSDTSGDSGYDAEGNSGMDTAKGQYAQHYGTAAAAAAFDYNSAAADYGKTHGITSQAQTFGDHQDTKDGGTAMSADTSNGVTVFSPQNDNGASAVGNKGPHSFTNGSYSSNTNNSGGPDTSTVDNDSAGDVTTNNDDNATTTNGGSTGPQNFINSSDPSGDFGNGQNSSTINGGSTTNNGSPINNDAGTTVSNGAGGHTPNNQFVPQGANNPSAQSVTQNNDNGATGQGITQNYDNGLNQGQSFDAYGGGNTGGISNNGTTYGTTTDYGSGFQPDDSNAGYTPAQPNNDSITGHYGDDTINKGGGFQPKPMSTNTNTTEVNHHFGYKEPSTPYEGSKPATSKVVNNYDVPLHGSDDGHFHDDLGHVFTDKQAQGHPLEQAESLKPHR